MKQSQQVPMYRQGDVLLVARSAKIPKSAMLTPRDNGRVVLAYGEVTGHAHALLDDGVDLYEDAAKEVRVLKVDALSSLVHEEHGTITLAPGLYDVIQQREYTPDAIRNVAD
jgi:hypothetical protein